LIMRGKALLLCAVGMTVLSVAHLSSARGDTSPDRPNILLIMADDVGREALGCYGGTSYKTPHLDALAAGGIRFDHCYSMPVCHPTRLTIMTGRYPFRNPAGWGRWPVGVQTFAHVLQRAGYATAVAGKWQLTLMKRDPDHARELGFDESALFGWHEGPRYHNPLIYRNGAIWKEVRKPDVYGPDVYTEFLIDFISRHKDKPFFAYYPMALCHEISDDFLPVPPPAPDGQYLTFKQMVEDMDVMVGRFVTALERLKLRDKTLILFTTDNGSPRSYLTHVEELNGKVVRHHKPVISMTGDQPVRGGKGSMTDAGCRVPLIANWPGTTPADREFDDLIDFTDLLPTLAELAEAKLPDNVRLDGRSFAPRLQDQPGTPREWVFCQHGGKQFVRTHQWKLYSDGRLFDMRRDPREMHPIDRAADSPQCTAARQQLQDVLTGLKVE
jgi:arylsulfatase A